MKKTRTLMMAMMLPMTVAVTLPVYAGYDAFRPQEIINVASGETLRATDEGFSIDLSQMNQGITTDNRTAMMKDGQGTFILDKNQDMYCSLVVREGTVIIGGTEERVTVNNNPRVESSLFMVGGINAELVLDNADVTQTAGGTFVAKDAEGNPIKNAQGKDVTYTSSSVTAVCVGGRDGDGTLTLRNTATLKFAQTLFLGGMSYAGELSASNPTNAHISGSYVSAEGGTLYRDKAIENGGFSNAYEWGSGDDHEKLSTATVNVESGAHLNTGIGLYAGNSTINVTGAGSQLNVGVRAAKADGFILGWIGYDVPAKTTLNVTNGGVVNGGVTDYNKWFDVGSSVNSLVEINVSGKDETTGDVSQLNIECGTAYLACNQGASATFNITDGATSVINAAHSYNWQSGGEYYPSGSKVYMADSEGSSVDINVVRGASMSINAVSTTNTYTTTDKVTHTLEAPGQVFMAWENDSHVNLNVADHSELSIYGEDAVVVGIAANSSVLMNVDDSSSLSLKSLGELSFGWDTDALVDMNVTNGSTLSMSGGDIVQIGAYNGSQVNLTVNGGSTLSIKSENNVQFGLNEYDSSAPQHNSQLNIDVKGASTMELQSGEEWGQSVSFGKWIYAYGVSTDAISGTTARLNAEGGSTIRMKGYEANFGGGYHDDIVVTLKDSAMVVEKNLTVGCGAQLSMEGSSSLSFESDSSLLSVSSGQMTVGAGAIVTVDDYNVGGDATYGASLTNSGTMKLGRFNSSGYSEVTNHGTMSMTKSSSFGGKEGLLTNDGEMEITQFNLKRYGTMINYGTISASNGESATLIITNDTRLQTGEVLISGCEMPAAATHTLATEYNTGLDDGVAVTFATQYSAKKTLTLGALLTGKDEMQYLSSADLQGINNAVLSGLNLAKPDGEGYVSDENGNYLAVNDKYTIVYKHEIGKNITLTYTTDHLNNVTGQESIAVNGGAVLVEQGEGDHHVGTLGSYVSETTETAAAVAVGESKSGSSVIWEGDGLKTVAGETTNLVKETTVKIGTDEQKGTLTVVQSSTLNNQGEVQTDEVEVEGTLDNNGTIAAATTVKAGGTLKGSGTLGDTTVQSGGSMVVGNSPGAPTIEGNLVLDSDSLTVFSVAGVKTPSGKKLTGWDSASYSQITITNEGVLTLDGGAEFRIEFGGSILNAANEGKPLEFDMTLVTAAPGKINLNEAALTDLLAHTEFLISQEEGANGSGWSISTKDVSYYVAGDGSALHLKGGVTLSNPAVPEPATATLSLLALAALAARRRRH